MSRIAILLVGVLAGCSTMQSSRTLARGKTQVAVGATRIAPNDQLGEPLYMGELRISHGTSEGFEMGGHVARTPGGGSTYSALGIDPKFQLSHGDTSWVSLAIPVSVAWADKSLHDMQGGTIEVFPTLYVGSMIAKNVEAVFAPRIGIARPYSGDQSVYGIGVTLGLRFGDHESGSALHPELGVFHLTDLGGGDGGDGGATFVTIGIGVTAGD